MGPHRAKALALVLALLPISAMAQSPGWSYSPLPGEGDRASLGCARDSTAENFTCIAVRCEDDFTTGLHLYSSRPGGSVGTWEMTLDREDRALEVVTDASPYGATILDREGWLLERLGQGTFAYLRHSEDPDGEFAFISLAGSLHAIIEALHWCAPRVPQAEQNAEPGVLSPNANGEHHESPPAGTQ